MLVIPIMLVIPVIPVMLVIPIMLVIPVMLVMCVMCVVLCVCLSPASVYLLRLFVLCVMSRLVCLSPASVCVMCYVSSRFVYLPIHSNALNSISLKA